MKFDLTDIRKWKTNDLKKKRKDDLVIDLGNVNELLKVENNRNNWFD